MGSERLRGADSRISIFQKDFWESRICDRCKRNCYLSCEVFPNSKIRIVRYSPPGKPTRKFTLTSPRHICLAENMKGWGEGEDGEDLEKAKEEEVCALNKEFKIFPAFKDVVLWEFNSLRPKQSK